MKKVKKNLFGMGLALSMMLGMVFALMPQEVKANIQEDAEWYVCDYSPGVDSDGIYVMSTCTDKKGNCCNMKGSKHRIPVPINLLF